MTKTLTALRCTITLPLAALMLAGCMHSQSRRIDMSYPTDYRQRHPILVSSTRAALPHQCGQWPGDLGVSDPVMDAHNKPYWNYGCATQQNLATMVANPSDLLRPARETPPDANRRTGNHGKYTEGKATSFDYQDQYSKAAHDRPLVTGTSR